MFNIDRYINKSIVNQFPSFVKNLNEAKSQKAFFNKIFSMADELADVVNAERAAGERTERQAAAIRGYAERGRTTAARETAAAAKARAAAADRIAAARESTAAANVAATAAKAQTARQLASVEAIGARAEGQRAAQLNVARIKDLEAKAALNSARAAAISDPENSDENIAMEFAKEVANRNAAPAIPAPTERESSAKNAGETLKGVLAGKIKSPTELQLQPVAGRGLVLPQPKKGTPSIELEPEPTSTTSKPAAAKKPKSKPSVNAKTKAADKPAPTPAPVKKEELKKKPEPKKKQEPKPQPKKSKVKPASDTKKTSSGGSGLMPEHAMMAAQIRRENLMRKRNENPPDERE